MLCGATVCETELHCTSHQAKSAKSGPFNRDFLPWWGQRGGLYIHTPVMWLHCFDNRQPGGSRPAEVDEGEDAACVSQSTPGGLSFCV